MSRPFVPEMKRMMPLFLNSTTSSPSIPQIPSPSPRTSSSSKPRSSIHKSRSFEPILSRSQNSQHPFTATDHVIMRMEFVRPAVDIEELWVECFEKWSKIHRKATADQWRWLYENRVMPTESSELSVDPAVAEKQLRSSRSLGVMNNNSTFDNQSTPKPSSLLIRRSRRKAEGSQALDLEKTPTPLNLQPVITRDTGCYAKTDRLSAVYANNKIAPILRPGSENWNDSIYIEYDTSSDESTDCAESSKSIQESIDTATTSILSSRASRRGESLGPHFVWTGSDSTVQSSEAQLEEELESCFEFDSDDEDFVSLSSGYSRHSMASCDEGFIPTPLTAIPAKAYKNPQQVQVSRTSSESNREDCHLSLMPDGLRIPRARSIPSSAIRGEPKVTPWTSTPPLSPVRHSKVIECDQNLLPTNPPRSSSLPRVSNQLPVLESRFSAYSEDSCLTLESPPLTPEDYASSEKGSLKEDNFVTPTQESVLQESRRNIPKAKLDFEVKPQASLSSVDTAIGDTPLFRHPAILPSQIASFSTEDEYILHDLEKAVCSVKPSLSLSTPCITQIRIKTHSKINIQTAAASQATNASTSTNKQSSQTHSQHPLKSHPPNMTSPSKSPKKPTKLFTQQPHSKIGMAILNLNTRQTQNRRSSRDMTPHQQTRLTPSSPDLASFRIIFPSTTEQKRDELYAYLLAYNYLTDLPKPLNNNRSQTSYHPHRINHSQDNKLRRNAKANGGSAVINNELKTPFSKTSIPASRERPSTAQPSFSFPRLPTPETVVTEKAAATLGIMSSVESLRTVGLEWLVKGLIERVKEGISRLVGEMDVTNISPLAGRPGTSSSQKSTASQWGGNGGVSKRGPNYTIENTLLRTLLEHVGVCEENGWLYEENGGLWKKIFSKVRGGMGIGSA